MFGAIVSETFNQCVETLLGRVPGLAQVKKIFDATTAELARAGKASQSFNVGEWIKTQRSAIDKQLRGTYTRDKREDLKYDLEEIYLDQDADGRDEFFDQISRVTRALSGPVGPSIDEMEVKLYEQWINSYYGFVKYKINGVIDYRIVLEDKAMKFKSCNVTAPFGDKVDSALNLLLNQGAIHAIRRPLDFQVKKYVCFYTENLVGGTSWDCGILDAQNRIVQEPLYGASKAALRQFSWLPISRFSIK